MANLKTNRALVFGLRFCALTFFDKNRLSGFRRDDAAGGDRGGLPHAATKEFARSYRINLRLLPELAVSSGHDGRSLAKSCLGFTLSLPDFHPKPA